MSPPPPSRASPPRGPGAQSQSLGVGAAAQGPEGGGLEDAEGEERLSQAATREGSAALDRLSHGPAEPGGILSTACAEHTVPRLGAASASLDSAREPRPGAPLHLP